MSLTTRHSAHVHELPLFSRAPPVSMYLASPSQEAPPESEQPDFPQSWREAVVQLCEGGKGTAVGI